MLYMKKPSKVVSLNRLNLSFILKCDRVKLLLYVLSAIGLILGFILYSKDNNSSYFAGYIFSKIIKFKLRKDFITSFIFAFSAFLSIVVISIILGASVFGIVVVPVIALLLNGFFGTVLALSYQKYQIGGLAFNSVLLIPSYTVFLIAIIISSTAVLKYSLFQLNSLIKNNGGGKISFEFNIMLKKELWVLLIIIADSVFEVALNCIFVKAFDFL